MTTQEIKTMIEYYGMSRAGDNIRITKHQDEMKKNLTQIKAAKPEIMAYWKAEDERRAQESRRKDETFYSIPGVRALSEARKEWSNYHSKFNYAMEHDIQLPTPPKSDIDALEKNELAVWALQVKKESLSTNYEISDYAGRAFQALRNGEDPKTVRAAYLEDQKAFLERHQWN